MSYESLAIIFVALAIGSVGKAAIGFGLPLIAVPVMAAFIGVQHAVVVMVIPATASNVWLVLHNRRAFGAIPNMGLTLGAGIVGIFVGTWMLSILDDRVLELILAAWIAVYLATRLVRIGPRVPVARLRALSPLAVFAAGGSQGATGASGPIVVPYFYSLGLETAAYVFAINLVFLTFGITQMIAMSSLGLFTQARMMEGLLALVPVLVLTPVGLWVGRVISRRAFDAAVMVLLLVSGARLAWTGIAGG